MSELTRYCTQCDSRISNESSQNCSVCGAEILSSLLYVPVQPVTKPERSEGRSEVPRKEWSAGIGAMLMGGVIYGFLWSLTIFLIPDGRVDFIFTIGDYLIDGITYTRIADIGWFLVMLLILLAHQKDLQPDAWKFHIEKFLPGWLASFLADWLKQAMLVGVFVIHFMYLRSLELGFLESVF